MRGASMLLALAALPVPTHAQQPEGFRGSMLAEARAQQEVAILGRFSAENRAKLERILNDTRGRNLPTRLLIDRMTAAKQKGVAESEIVSSTEALARHLEQAGRALVRGGRGSPDDRELGLAATILERGCSPVQLQSVIRTANPSRSLVVPFDVMLKLADKGMSIDAAAAQVSGKLVQNASDGDIRALVDG